LLARVRLVLGEDAASFVGEVVDEPLVGGAGRLREVGRMLGRSTHEFRLLCGLGHGGGGNLCRARFHDWLDVAEPAGVGAAVVCRCLLSLVTPYLRVYIAGRALVKHRGTR
jgi:hypothetical protein